MGIRSFLYSRLDRWFKRENISRPGVGLFLVRWHLGEFRGRRLMLHHFLRSDPDVLHDHPWNFRSVILSGGYWEHTPAGRRWYGPGRILTRKAEYRHRVEPHPNGCWTLVLTGGKIRSWGFWCPTGWVPWRKFQRSLDAGGAGCGGEE